MKPKLRFPGYEEEWEEKKLGDVAEQIQRGASPRPISDKKWFDDCSSIGWIRISDITRNGKYIYDVEQKLSEDGISKSRFLSTNNLILSIAATIGKPVINKIPVCIHDGFIVFKNILPSNDIEFLYYYLLYIRPSWFKYQQPGSQFNLNSDLVRSHNIFLPSLPEQEKIGEFFSLLDQRIEKQEEKIELMKERKKGWMQKVFHQEIRFKDENGNDYPDWEEEKLGDIVNFENNRRKPITESDRKKGDYPYYGATGIVDYVDNYIFDGTRLLVGEDGADWSAFSKTAFIAKGQYWVNNHAHVIKSDKCNLIFLMNQLNYMELRKWVCGNAPAKLNLESIKSIILNLPSLPEQEKIANFLSTQDELIEKEEEKLNLLKEQKKGLLQQMFV